jgi:hypothetical protein
MAMAAKKPVVHYADPSMDSEYGDSFVPYCGATHGRSAREASYQKRGVTCKRCRRMDIFKRRN